MVLAQWGGNVLFTKDFEGTILVNKIPGKKYWTLRMMASGVRVWVRRKLAFVVLWALDKGV